MIHLAKNTLEKMNPHWSKMSCSRVETQESTVPLGFLVAYHSLIEGAGRTGEMLRVISVENGSRTKASNFQHISKIEQD